jgi:hypothetical protein
MDTRLNYRDIIEQVLADYAQLPYAYGQVQKLTVFDRVRDHYMLVTVGWDERRVHGVLVHIDLIDDKCWIQRDGTEEGIAYDLEAAGIPKSQIVLAFHPEEVRQYTGYAVA